MSYDPLADDHKLRDAIIAVFQRLRDDLGPGVTLAEVTAKFNEVYGLNYTEADVAPYLSQNLQSKRQQGVSSTSTEAGVLSDAAASESAAAAEADNQESHVKAAVCHEDAAKAHRAAARFHERTAEYHNDKAERTA